MSLRAISVSLSATLGNYASTFKQAGAATRQLGGELGTLAETSKSKFETLTGAATKVGLGLAGAFVGVVASAASFDKQMSEVQAVSGASAAGMGKLRTAAINAGQATVFSAGQAAEAEAELAKAGLTTSQILGGGLTGAMALASAGSLGLADAATDTATAINEFQLNGSSASHVADLLSAGANKSATDVKGLADSLNQAGVIAHSTDMSIEDTVGTLAAFAQAGLKGSDAGTSLKTMLQALQAPSNKTKELMDSLGISAYDASGKFIGITALAQQLKNQLGGLTQGERQYALSQIFGTDAARGANIAMENGAKGIQTWINAVNQTGAASDTARQKMNNLAGDVENLKGSIETLTISTGEGAQSGLRGMAQAATRAVNQFGLMPATVSKYGTAVAGMVGAAVLGGVALAKMRAKSAELQTTLSEMGPAGAKAASGLSTMTGIVSKLTVAFGVMQAVGAAFGSSINTPVTTTVKNLTTLGDTGKATGQDLQHLNYDLGTLGSGGMAKFGNGLEGFAESIDQMGGVLDESLFHAKQRLADIDAGLAAMVSSGNIQGAQAAYNQLATAADKAGISQSDLNAGLPNYEGALDGLKDSANGAAGATGGLDTSQADAAASGASLAAQQEGVAHSIEDTVGAADKLKTLLEGLNNAGQSQLAAESDLAASYDAATVAIKKNGRTAREHGTVLDDASAKGRANIAVLIDLAKKTEATAEADDDAGASANRISSDLDKGRKKIIATAEAMGLNSTAAKKLADKILSIPPKSSTKVSAPGLSSTYSQLKGYARELDALNGKTSYSKVITHFLNEGAKDPSTFYHGTGRWGLAYTHAADGLLSAADIFPSKDPGRYLIAEPGTGGEAFVPKNGNYGRSTAIIDTAARWYGGRFAPAGSGGFGAGGSSYAPTVTNNIYPQQANWTVQDFQALQARTDTLLRVGRRH